MTSFKKQFIAATVVATLALGAGSAYAFNGGGRGQVDAAERFDYIFTQLELTDAQRTEVLAVLEANWDAQRDAMWEVRQSLMDREERPSYEEMQAIRDAHQADMTQQLTDELNVILRPDVTAEFIEYMEAHRGGFGPGSRGGMGERGGPGKR
ncbi:hypothetical protein [Reinekea blandensis]|uniref:Zinc resistance-associated protein n=1 Tax=Reinekea blandensis MED297 TaxID=314283 RepID=A4BII2_9GAMM|nr:hypothetical protein [Reinekea blandensis]EAR08061.1 hypothetical protein MED297_07456 [Reinekea sp. MED297] [Reinekea blandensis MED297]